jgi:hypothetical protein
MDDDAVPEEQVTGLPAEFGASAVLLDPLDGRGGRAAIRRGRHGALEIYLQIASGQSVIVRTYDAGTMPRGLSPWPYAQARAEPVALQGEWQLEFIKGGPVLPASATLRTLASWTSIGDAETKRFAGTARYRLEFDAPAQRAQAWELDLGDVRETARVTLNGKQLDGQEYGKVTDYAFITDEAGHVSLVCGPDALKAGEKKTREEAVCGFRMNIDTDTCESYAMYGITDYVKQVQAILDKHIAA